MKERVALTRAEIAKRWRERNPEKNKQTKKDCWYRNHENNIQKSRENYKNNIDKRREQSLHAYHKDRSKMANSRLKRLFGITLDQYNEMLAAQNYVCAICKKPETMMDNKQIDIRKLAVDHCHSTGKVRGLLCFACNIGLGKFKECSKTLLSAYQYLTIK